LSEKRTFLTDSGKMTET